MKQKLLMLLFTFCASGLVLAQDNTLTPAQRAELQAAAEEIDAQCQLPAKPAIPEAAGATEDELLATQKALKAFLEVGEGYLACLETMEGEWGDEITETQKALVAALYNQVVDAMQSTADEFNAVVRAFKAANSN